MRSSSPLCVLLVAFVVISGCARPVVNATSNDHSLSTPIPMDELNQRAVIGRLDVPLGQVVEIEAIVIDGDKDPETRDQRRYMASTLLRITHVNGHPHQKRVFEFYCSGDVKDYDRRSNRADKTLFKLFELSGGKDDQSMPVSPERRQAAAQYYYGRTVHLLGYESGGFYGHPANAQPIIPIGMAMPWGFYPSLHIVGERD